jgi:NADP-dependent 3-hydroxy acid dehydrogenase YdfG
MASSRYAPLDITGWTVLITGASSGFGLSTAWRFAELGCKLVLVARREERLVALKAELEAAYSGLAVHCLRVDMMDTDAVEAMPAALPEAFADVDILVNNAGLALGKAGADATVTSDVVRMVQTNVTGLIVCTAAFTKGMKARGRGHVINVGSVSGHEVYPGGAAYCASKHAVTAFTAGARHDLVGTPIRVTCISPGFAETEFSIVRFKEDEAKAKAVYTDLVPLYADDIADQICYAATRPAHVQIADIICWPTNQAGPTNIARVGANLGAPAK